MPVLSVIVTAYNIEPYIGECLQDILAQTHRDMEIIVVDDGSSDGTPDVIRAWAARDGRIRTHLMAENSVGGVATAANAGIELATGRFIGFADGDDRFEPTMFEKLVTAAEASGAELAMCSYLNWDAASGETALPPDEQRWNEIAPEGVVDLTEAARHRLLTLNAVPWRKLYDARLLKGRAIRFPVGDFFFEDNPFHWFNVLSANRVTFVDERLCRHRVNRLGQTTAAVDRKLLRMFEHHAIIMDWLERSGLRPSFGQDLLIWAARQLSWIGRKCPPELRADLFEATRKVVAPHSGTELQAPGIREIIGRRTSELLFAAQRADFDAFCRLLDQAAGRAPRRRSEAKESGLRARLRDLWRR